MAFDTRHSYLGCAKASELKDCNEPVALESSNREGSRAGLNANSSGCLEITKTRGSFNDLFARTLLKQAHLDRPDLIPFFSALMEGARNGHLCMTKQDLGSIPENLPASLVEEGNLLYPRKPIIHYKEHYYLQKNWVYESVILQHMQRLRHNNPLFLFDPLIFQNKLREIRPQLLSAQEMAIASALQNSLLVICGGPGTGKTYTAGHLSRLLFQSSLSKPPFRIIATAPTGKAAAHLKTSLERQHPPDSALHIEAMTLHRMLRLQPSDNRLFSYRPIDAHLVIVDEASMMDVSLLAHLLESISEETILVLMGDPNQLPPIGAVSLFAEIGELFGIVLDACVRTEEPILQTIASAVQEGNKEKLFSLLSEKHPALLWEPEIPDPEELYQKTSGHLGEIALGSEELFRQCNRFRILNPMRQGPMGIDLLNQRIFQQTLLHHKKWIAPILATANDPFSELYNGMGGVLCGGSCEKETAYFPQESLPGNGREFSPPPPFEIAFCLSVHKSQGSEFEEVMAIFPEGSEHFGKEAFYTAITRAKKRLELRGKKETFEKMLFSSVRKRSGLSLRASQRGA